MNKITIATRQSKLALWQANYVKSRIESLHNIEVELLPITTKGDIIIDQPLAKIGGKGLFVKELERALLEKKADIAVHSMKDVPMQLPEGLVIPVICEREDPRDVIVSRHDVSFQQLTTGSIIGTSSARRREQLRRSCPHFNYVDIRGNVGTRLEKLASGQYDALVLAAAGMIRLGLGGKISEYLPCKDHIPSPGQGAIGIECRREDKALIELLAPLSHEPTQCCVTAERAFSATLNGSCELPLGAYAVLKGDEIHLSTFLAKPDGSCTMVYFERGPKNRAAGLGILVANAMLSKGADKIIQSCKHDT